MAADDVNITGAEVIRPYCVVYNLELTMKKIIAICASMLLIAPMLLLFACGSPSTAEIIADIWQDAFADEQFPNAGAITDLTVYRNHQVHNGQVNIRSSDDVNFMLYNGDVSRFVNMSDGYAVTLSGADYEVCHRISALRTQLISEERTISISREMQNPYYPQRNCDDCCSVYGYERGWLIYYDEWLVRFIGDMRFRRTNRLDTLRNIRSHDSTILDGWVISTYDIVIRDNENIDKPFYNIAIVRREGHYIRHLIIVQKASRNMTAEFDAMIASLSEFEPQGTARNDMTPFPVQRPDYWDDATRNFFDKLMDNEEINWGFFTNSMAGDNEPADWVNNTTRWLRERQPYLQELLDTTFTIMPTYLHLSWHGRLIGFPTTLANEWARGDGFNGRPVLQVTYQFTDNNNGNLYGYTPMFRILNGHYDDHFRELAQSFIEYGYPILFRLNNEMDADWVSYAAIVTLLDPDIFTATWERMYGIFRDEGVTNAIWIFNPNCTSVPFSSWGEWNTYMPRLDTMHVLGITAYEFGNNVPFNTFTSLYTNIYTRYREQFGDWVWAISEFAAGNGGERAGQSIDRYELGRNDEEQAQWITEMFYIFNNINLPEHAFARNIRVAVWFNVNDYGELNGERYIMNHLRIGSHAPLAIEAFRRGINRID